MIYGTIWQLVLAFCLLAFQLPQRLEASQPEQPRENVSAHVDFDFRSRGTAESIYGLIERVLSVDKSWAKQKFDLAIETEMEPNISPPFGFYSICDGLDNKIKIRGASGPDLGFGVATYLRKVYSMSFSWNRTGGHQTDNLNRDLQLPLRKVGACINGERAVQISYFNNVVTFSYSYVWYLFSEWSYLLDWMTLSGINLSIAYTGQEEIFRKVFNSFGITNLEFSSWTNGIAYLAWSRGQRLHGCGGGLQLKVMKQQWNLQRQILKRMRELGIVAVLPTFQGNMPSSMRSLFPNATISRSGVAWVDGTDPLFQEIQTRYMDVLLRDFGTDHWYETDGYFNFAPEPWLKHTENMQNNQCKYNVATMANSTISAQSNFRLSDSFSEEDGFQHATSVYQSMVSRDPKAVWLYQGWVWRGWGKDRLPYMRGFERGSPTGRFVVLDMFDEIHSEWDKFDYFAYFQRPYIWSTLHNFGGNLGLWGDMDLLEAAPRIAVQKTTSLAGVGAAPEGIDHNPAYYNLLFDMPWRLASTPLQGSTAQERVSTFLRSFAEQRYGVEDPDATQAWALLHETVYGALNEPLIRSREWLSEKSSDGVTALAYGGYFNTPYKTWFSLPKVAKAWQLLQQVAARHETVPRTLTYDLVNTGREVLSKLSNEHFLQMTNSSFSDQVRIRAGQTLRSIQQDLDELLCTEASFSLQEVLNKAEALAKNIDSEDLELLEVFLIQARSQSTTWGPQLPNASKPDSTNLDYANKHWAGQIDGFYTIRTNCYLDNLHSKSKFQHCVANGSYLWTHRIDKKLKCSESLSRNTSNAVKVSEMLLRKYLNDHVYNVVL